MTSKASTVGVGTGRATAIGIAAMTALLLVAPLAIYPVFLMQAMCFALFASAYDLVLGQAGLLGFGHAAFLGLGAYLAAEFARDFGLSAELCLIVATIGAGALGVAFGWLAIRRQGIYFAMITLALGRVVYFACNEAPFTGGENGLQLAARPALFGIVSLADDRAMYGLTCVVFLAAFLALHRIVRSPFGHVLRGVRDNEKRAVSLGYRANDYKLLAFTLSAALAGLAGGLKALVTSIATLTDIDWPMSGQVILMTLVGGLGTLFGPAVGAVVLVGLQYFLAGIGSWVPVIQGAIFVACVLLFRRGIVGELSAAPQTPL